MTPPVTAVVFDLDGTLLDHSAASRAGLTTLLDALQVQHLTVDDLAAEWVRLEDEHYETWRQGLISFSEQRRRRLRGLLPLIDRELPETALDATFAAYLVGYEAGWSAYDDAGAAVARVRDAGLAVAVLTNGDQEQQTAKLRAIGLLDACGPVLASSSIGAPKPSAAAYLAACAAVGAEPDRVLMVGDNLELDVLAPRAAGLRAVHLDRAGNHPVPERHRVRSLSELSTYWD